MAHTEVGGPVHGGESFSSVGNELVKIPHPQDFLAMPLPGEPHKSWIRPARRMQAARPSWLRP